ncbi:hypothetical protein GALMADRAFT_75998 [Galerina marginata CBS 339.88]|uniref:Ig-like domain-containing protein n=1 Tax=Galerina marginata (strain CBS 339.88) TaxID=685588 RepID=A0A067SIG7_GALM3|nr:hypothetical protein GALMADRAFT_75998 [Galerina marginata CBS 339.88]
MYLLHLLAAAIVLQVSFFAFAQDAADGSSIPSCTFSCPETNSLSWSLVKRPHTIGFNTYYSIFECVYSTPSVSTTRSEHKCSYYKHTGSQALGAAGDNCPPNAIPCSQPSSPEAAGEAATTPLFSHQDNEELPAWVESGRYLLYLQEHHSG